MSWNCPECGKNVEPGSADKDKCGRLADRSARAWKWAREARDTLLADKEAKWRAWAWEDWLAKDKAAAERAWALSMAATDDDAERRRRLDAASKAWKAAAEDAEDEAELLAERRLMTSAAAETRAEELLKADLMKASAAADAAALAADKADLDAAKKKKAAADSKKAAKTVTWTFFPSKSSLQKKEAAAAAATAAAAARDAALAAKKKKDETAAWAKMLADMGAYASTRALEAEKLLLAEAEKAEKKAKHCCNCLIMQGILNIRCSHCLRIEIKTDAQDSLGSPPKEVRSITIENLEILCSELAKTCKSETLEKMKEKALEKGKDDLAKKFDLMIKAGKVDEEDICSNWIRFYVLAGEEHPAKSHPQRFSKDFAHIATTYQWTLGLGKKKGLLSKLQGLHKKLLIFLDVLFIDQNNNNVVLSLAKAQEIYGLLPFHVVIAKGEDKLLDRGWCVFEICLRAKAGLATVVIGDDNELGFQGPIHDYYGNIKLSFEADKEQIDAALRWTYGYAADSSHADGSIINSVLVMQILSSRFNSTILGPSLPKNEGLLPPATLAAMQ